MLSKLGFVREVKILFSLILVTN